MRTNLSSASNDRCLCKTSFEADPADPDTFFIEVVYEVHRPADNDFTIDGDPHFLEKLSCTRTDTRETVHLSPKQEQDVKQAAITKVAESKLWGT